MVNKIVFLCGARDFHAMDWYRSAEEQLPRARICLLTDLIEGEGFTKLINKNDEVFKLLIIDRFLLKNQSKIGNIWRNIVKLIVFPLQIHLLKKFAKKHPNAIFHAHSMYYLWLAAAAGVEFIGTPQGSDILVKPFRTKFYRKFSIWALKKAKSVTVDSVKMRDMCIEISGVIPEIIQNGIDLKSIEAFLITRNFDSNDRKKILSTRGLSPLYRIERIVQSRNNIKNFEDFPITFIYPFHEDEYKQKTFSILKSVDLDLGRITRNKMYELLFESKLVISIPSSDSSPRSVYEAIFCGCAVAITYHTYYDILPDCMKKRIVLIDLEDNNWFIKAINTANSIVNQKFKPSEEALDLFDQKRSFMKILNLIDK